MNLPKKDPKLAYPRLLACAFLLSLFPSATLGSAQVPDAAFSFLEDHCLDCHDSSEQKGDLDLENLSFDLSDRETFAKWVLLHDRADHGEMPPKKKRRPEPEELKRFLKTLARPMERADRQRIAQTGRSTVRRLNRFEYENTLRELLQAPWLQVATRLPEDGIAHLYNKIGERLDVSHVQMGKYLETADYALRTAMNAAAFPSQTTKHYVREEPTPLNYLKYRSGQNAPTRAAIPLLGLESQVEIIRGNQPVTVGEADPETREQEALGFVSGTYTATTKYDFTRMETPTDGRYRLRMKTYTFTAGPNGAKGGDDHGLTGGQKAWWRPNRGEVFPGKRSEPITLYALARSGDSRWLTTFDSFPEPQIIEREVILKAGEGIRPDAGRLVRTRPGWKGNPNATHEGIPGFAINWLEVEGPLSEEWPPRSYQALFGDLPFETSKENRVRVRSENPEADARRLLLAFMQAGYRQPLANKKSVEPFLKIYHRATELGEDFTDAMIAAFASVLCSTDFLYLESQAGSLDSNELASRLSYFLWNGPPDQELRQTRNLRNASTLRKQSERLLDDPRSERFINAFLDYWLDLREINANTPDAILYPEYYLDDQLTEASLQETRLFFRELVERDLPVRNLLDSDFTYVNERLARHYGLNPVEGVQLRRASLPEDSPRGGLLTQASVLRVTANGTTTSPVLRGTWIMERIMGMDIPSPPSNVGAVEPDTRGATTLREQLEKHRANESCNSCHVKLDPAGFALESFDTAGGWRDWYRGTGDNGEAIEGFGKNGHAFAYRNAQPVNSSGNLTDGRSFENIKELKAHLLTDERTIARNLLRQFIVYATGAPTNFSERSQVEKILDRCEADGYGVRTLLHAAIQSEFFKIK